MLERCRGGDALVGKVVAVPKASPRAATLLSTVGDFFCPCAECMELPVEAEEGFGTGEGGGGRQQDPAHGAKQGSGPSKINQL